MMLVTYDTSTVTFLRSTMKTVFFSASLESFLFLPCYYSVIPQFCKSHFEIGILETQERFSQALDQEILEGRNFSFLFLFFSLSFSLYPVCQPNLSLTHKHTGQHGVMYIVVLYYIVVDLIFWTLCYCCLSHLQVCFIFQLA